ncbi:MAG: hypothetical protein NZM12_10880 [Steroidobacteraceae bacterium]|nr:hypothetical protein [Steroidobacteraceae bacterium]MDW8259663.1 lipid A biosynthesis acyltransferase [Gammaproteobacteria bacterium]
MTLPPLKLLLPWHWPTWLGLGLLRLLLVLPIGLRIAVGRAIGRAVGRLPLAYARIARSNLQICFPELDEAARTELLRRHFASLGIGLAETALSWWGRRETVMSMTEVVGLPHLQAALARGRGVIMIGGHFTTIQLAIRILNELEPVNILYRPTHNAVLTWMFEHQYARQARRAIAYDDTRTLLRALKENGVLWYAPDQAFRKKGAAMIKFFGTPAATNTATTRLVKLSGATVLPYFPERLADARHYRVYIGPPLEPLPGDSPEDDAALFLRALEAHVRRVPEQYLWIHRRFKGLSPDYPDYYGRDRRA